MRHIPLLHPVALLLSLATPASTLSGQPVPGQWTTAAHDPAGTRFSPLDQITPRNLGQLAEIWRLPTGVTGPHEGAPLVVDSMLYLHTPHPNRVLAINLARPDSVLWRYQAPVSAAPPETGFRDTGTRGLAWHPDGIIIVPVTAGYLAGISATTGREIWRLRNSEGRVGATTQAAPVVIGDVVVVGMAGSEFGVRGYLSGYRAQTGQLLWRAYSAGDDQDVLLDGPANIQYPTHAARNLGATTWPRNAWQRGGGSTDGALTWDTQLQLVFHGTGAPSPWNALLRPGDNKWTSSIVAREVATGRVRWAYQLTPNDAWGYGAEGENILADLIIGGREVKALLHIGRNGFIYTLDRTNGRVLRVERGGPANWASLVSPSTGLPAREPRMVPAAASAVRGICPATFGLKGQPPAAFSPPLGLVFAPLNNLCMDVRPAAPHFAPAELALGATWRLSAGPGSALGRFVAWDPAAAAIRWEVREPVPVTGGALATASGLVFYATGDGLLKALDQATGAELWRTTLPGVSVGAPLTFLGPDGRQYLAILTGPGGWMAVPELGAVPGWPWRGHEEGILVMYTLPDPPPV